MNERKLRSLFSAARQQAAPAPSPGFEARVLQAIRCERPPETVLLFDALNRFFPRLALAASLVIALSLLADLCVSTFTQPDLSTGVAEIAEQWLFAVR